MIIFLFSLAYNLLAMPLLWCITRLIAFRIPKLRTRLRGISATYQELRTLHSTTSAQFHHKQRIWFHAASAGEFEQIKPVIEEIRSRRPDIWIIVTMYSASGYTAHRHYTMCDMICYLPDDSWYGVRSFLRLVQPHCAIFSRYDLWWNMAHTLHRSAIPLYVINATLNPRAVQNPFGAWYISALYSHCTAVYTAGESETALFHAIGLGTTIHTSADTRIDHILRRVASAQNDTVFAPLRQGQFTLVVGSSWSADEERIIPAVEKLRAEGFGISLVLVPHEPTAEHIHHLQTIVPYAQCLSHIEHTLDTYHTGPEHASMIIDSIGKLLRLYAIADAAYIGGGFGFCVHSVLEPAGYGLALASGPNIALARDAIALHKEGALTLIHTTDDVYRWLKILLTDQQKKAYAEKTAHAYITSKRGSAQSIADQLLLEIR